jgi:hypothetical protein
VSGSTRPFAGGVARVRRAARKPPRVLARRLAAEARVGVERFVAPGRGRRFDERALLAATGASTLDVLWDSLLARPYPAATNHEALAGLAALAPAEPERVARLAELAARREVDLLGSGPVSLGRPTPWNVDFKTGEGWPAGWARGIDYVNLDRPSDVKVPWELSRMQWLLPAGQAYLLDGDEAHAAAAREVLDEWIAANPYGLGVNWAVTMEVAMRILSWSWLCRVFGASEAWREPGGFRSRLARSLYLHGDWTARNLELSDVNGNHLTADAAGLVFAGLFFGRGGASARWAERGWSLLVAELPRQVGADGVDFEGSIAYHRFVTELFLLPALYRLAAGLDVPDWYRDRLAGMARFAVTATRPDGTTPLVGDHDDARALPLGSQRRGDHRYLAGLVAATWPETGLGDVFSGPRTEVAWLVGAAAAETLPDRADVPLPSRGFEDAGWYVMRGPRGHVFVDCGPVGLAGRGGHGHNDCLSFEAWLDGESLITDSGCFVYTASPEWRNRLRATAAHNTPRVDGVEQNRLDPSLLWSLGSDAEAEVRRWTAGDVRDVLVAGHAGYRRLAFHVTPVRTLAFDHDACLLAVLDTFEGAGEHEVVVPFHLAPPGDAVEERPGRWRLDAGARTFALEWDDPAAWEATLRASWVAPSYGIRIESRVLELSRRGPLAPLLVAIGPAGGGVSLLETARRLLEEAR